MNVSLKPIDKALNAPIPEQLNILYRIILAVLPVTISSFFYNPIVPFFSLLTVFLILYTMRPVQDKLSTISVNEIYFFIGIPVYTYFLIWSGLLVSTGREIHIFRTVGIIFLLVSASTFPVYLPEKRRTAEKVTPTFTQIYSVVSFIVIFQQTFVFWEYIK